jgi:Zn-dependent metallo-hydrolase RNA specificity domain
MGRRSRRWRTLPCLTAAPGTATATLDIETDAGVRGVVFSIFGTDVPVRAEVQTIDGLSAHADTDGMMRWPRTVACSWSTAIPRPPPHSPSGCGASWDGS